MSVIRIFAIMATFLCVSCVAAPVEDVNNPQVRGELENYRLPRTIMPQNYNITLRPYLLESDGVKRFTFDGEAFITVVTSVETKSLVMHTKNLNYTVQEYWMSTSPSSKSKLSSFEFNPVTDKITYTLSVPLAEKNTYILHFKFTGSMDDDMHGFYRSSYQNNNNVTKWLGSTQFETNHARRVFPAFDEPNFKATFDINIVRHKSMKSISNTALRSTVRIGDYYTDVFERTPKMSTYIIAFLVSEFNDRSNGIFGVVARPEYYAQTQYSFDVGQKLLKELDTYFDLPYYDMGVTKMHLAAIPDFSAGAMENWGLLTFRERALLYDEGSTTLNAKQYIAAVVAHEEAHMWFGDLVTCDWWSYAWLNEGFARYFQYFATAKVETGFDMEKQFVVDQIHTVMTMDATNSTNPMSDENTNTPADLSRMFNSISYNKGASFIRMVKHAMGEDSFRKSLQNYLNKNKHTNAKPSNLLAQWEENWPSQHKPQASLVFKSFTEQVGYPVVKVNVSLENKNMAITQKRFLLNANDGSDNKLLYTIPFTYTTSLVRHFNATSPSLYLKATTNARVEALPADVKWVIANIQQTGYYRVNYDERNWRNIRSALVSSNWGDIHEINRAQIVDDLLNLARSSEIDYELALNVVEYLETEVSYVPWTAALNGFNYLAIRLGKDTKDFGIYIRQLTEKAYKILGFEEKTTDSALDIYNRAKILAWSCKYGNVECIAKAKAYFYNLTDISVNIRSVVYCTAMREGTEKDFNILFNKYKTEKSPTEETLILNSLGCVKNSKLIEKYFWIIIGEEIRRQDKSSALSSLYTSNNENVSPVFSLVTKNFEKVAKSFGGYPEVASIISSIASRFTEESQKKELHEFNSKNNAKFGSAAKSLDLAEASVAKNLEWSANKLGTFKQYLEKRSKSSATTNSFTVLSIVLVVLVAMLGH